LILSPPSYLHWAPGAPGLKRDKTDRCHWMNSPLAGELMTASTSICVVVVVLDDDDDDDD